MKRILMSTGAIVALAASAIFAFGDIARPKTTPTPEPKTIVYSGLEVATDSKAWEARLQVSEETWKRMQQAASRTAGSAHRMQNITHNSSRPLTAGLFSF